MKATLPSFGCISFDRKIHTSALTAFSKRQSFFLFLITLLLLSSAAKAQVPIVYYDFEKNTSRTTGETTVEQEVNSGSSAVTKVGSGSSAITYNNGAAVFNGGSSYGTCASATDWTTSTTDPATSAAKYYQFTASTAGFSGLKVAFEGEYSSSTTAPKICVLYSKDGVNFTASTTAAITVSSSWAPLMFFDLGASADNASSLTIRIYAYGVSSSTSRVDIDNIVLMASNQISGSKTLLNYVNLGTSLFSGTSINYAWTNFTVSGSGTECFLPADMNIAGTLTVSSGAILDCGTAVVGGGSSYYGQGTGTFVLSAGGTLRIGSTAGITASGSTGNIQTGVRTFSAAANYEYNGSANQSIGSGFPTSLTGTLTINHTNSSNKYVTLDVARTISSGGTVALQAGTFSTSSYLTLASGSTIWRSEGDMNGTISGSPALLFTGNSKTTTSEVGGTPASMNLNLNSGATLTLNSAVTMSGSLTLTAGTLDLGTSTQSIGGDIVRDGSTQTGVIKATSGTITFAGSSNQAIPAAAFSGYINNLTVNNATTVSASSDLTITNTLTLTAGTLTLKNTTLTMKGSISVSAGKINAAAGTVIFNGTYGQALNTAVFSNTTVNNLEINNSVNVTVTGNLTVSTSFAMTAGTVYLQGNTLTLNGSFTRTAGLLEAASGTLVFSGTAAQEIPASSVIGYQTGSGSIYKLTVNNAAGVKLQSNQTITSVLTMTAGYLDINGQTLILGGTVTGNGTLRGTSASSLTLAANGAVGTLSFDQTTDGTTNALGALLVTSGSAILGSKLNLYISLTISAGTLDLSAKNLVLKSNATQTAYVAEIKGTLSGESNVTVERYSPSWSTRRYRVMTSPVMNTTINAAWQEGSKWNGSTSASSTGYGTLITGQTQGNATTANANGFDYWSAVASSSASLRTYVAAASNTQATWQAVTSTLTANAFNSHQAYLLYVRGDRSASTGSTAGATTLRANGTLKKGSYTISVPYNKSHTLIGNPYASPIDFKAIYDANSSKIQSSFWIWQASLGTSTGGYVLVRPVTGSNGLYETIPGDGTQTTANRIIHSGEGFFVMPATNAVSGNSITISEANKSTTTPTVAVFRQIVAPAAKLYVNLFAGADSAKVLLDGVLSEFNNATSDDTVATVENNNMQKAVNSAENLSLFQAGNDFTFTSGNSPKSSDTLRLRIWSTAAKTYALQIRSANFAALGLTPVLVDNYLNKSTIINTADAMTTYTFAITSDAASKDALRFFIVYKSLSGTLPLSITNLKAEQKGAAVNVKWNVANESGIKTYEVEKSATGTTFKTLAVVNAKAGFGEQAYEQADGQPSATNYYRIKMIGTTGEVKYSSVVKVQLQKSGEDVSTYPNPVNSNSFNLQLTNKPQGTYTVSLYNVAGQMLTSKTIQHNGGSATETIALDKSLANGSYYLFVKDAAGQSNSMNINVQR